MADKPVLLQFSMTPLDKGESVSRYVARSLDIIDRSGLDYRTHAMGTILEGDLDACLAVVRACHARMAEDCNRISTTIKIDYRKGRSGRLTSKTASLERHLGRPLKKAGDPA